MNDFLLIYSTFNSHDEAISMAKRLLENRQIACANIYSNVDSLYEWQGTIEHTQEYVLFAKTVKEKADEVMAYIKAQHSYETPCIVALPISAGEPLYLAWLKGQCV